MSAATAITAPRPILRWPSRRRIRTFLYEGTQFLLQTSDEGETWKAISPDLTNRPGEPAPPSQAEEQNKPEANKSEETKTKEAESKKPKTQGRRGDHAASRPAARLPPFRLRRCNAGVIWVGTNNGLVQVTTDNGANWQNVSPPGLQKFSEVTMVEASHFDAGTAYVSVDNHQGNDFRPHIFSHSRFRKDLAGSRNRHSRFQLCQSCARRSGAQGIALRRHRELARSFRLMTAISGALCS